MTVRSINLLSDQQIITSAERIKNVADLIFLVECIPWLHGFRKCTVNSFGKRQLVLAMSPEEKPKYLPLLIFFKVLNFWY